MKTEFKLLAFISTSLVFWLSSRSNLEADFHDTNTENLVHDHKSKDSKLKSQNEGWNLGGHPSLPYHSTKEIIVMIWDFHIERHALEVPHRINTFYSMCTLHIENDFVIKVVFYDG